MTIIITAITIDYNITLQLYYTPSARAAEALKVYIVLHRGRLVHILTFENNCLRFYWNRRIYIVCHSAPTTCSESKYVIMIDQLGRGHLYYFVGFVRTVIFRAHYVYHFNSIFFIVVDSFTAGFPGKSDQIAVIKTESYLLMDENSVNF